MALIEALRLRRAAVAGVSMAGAFALEAARLAPDAIGAVIAVDAGIHYFSQGQEAAMAELRRGLVEDRAGTLAAAVPNWLRPTQARPSPIGSFARSSTRECSSTS